MTVRRVGRFAAIVFPILFWTACGQIYRPVVIPCSTGGVPGCPVETPPTPSSFHAVFGISTNIPSNAGGAMQIDVSGDSLIGETSTSTASAPNSGFNPTHIAISPNNSRLFVAAAASVFPGGVDAIASFNPAFQSTQATGFGAVNMINLPSLAGQSSSIASISEAGNVVTVTLSTPITNTVAGAAIAINGVFIPGCVLPCNSGAYNGTFPITAISGTTVQYLNPATGLAAASGGTASIPNQPVFVNSTENAFMYVANYNSNSVATINTTSNAVTNTAIVGTNPVSLAETPNALKLYVANQGSNTVSSLNPVDLTPNTVTGFTGVTPIWLVARGDSQKVYALTEGDGQLVTIDVGSDTVTSSLPVDPGANYIFLDPTLNRLYVTNPITQTVYVFSDTGGLSGGVVSDVPNLMGTISFKAGSTSCPAGCTPVSVTALLDGTRFYVATYEASTACPAGTGVTGACVIPRLTVFNANTLSLMYPSAPSLTLLVGPAPCTPTSSTSCQMNWPFVAGQTAVPQVASCATEPLYPALYTPSTTRFRVFTAASEDSTRVYVSMCDAGAIAAINTSGGNTNNPGTGLPADSLVTDLLAAPEPNSATAVQNPIFLLMGQ
ncbi:MAG: YncE family protein [Candidatus Sulfotelmatobacter sp.]